MKDALKSRVAIRNVGVGLRCLFNEKKTDKQQKSSCAVLKTLNIHSLP